MRLNILKLILSRNFLFNTFKTLIPIQNMNFQILEFLFSNQFLPVKVPYSLIVRPNFHCFFVHLINSISSYSSFRVHCWKYISVGSSFFIWPWHISFQNLTYWIPSVSLADLGLPGRNMKLNIFEAIRALTQLMKQQHWLRLMGRNNPLRTCSVWYHGNQNDFAEWRRRFSLNIASFKANWTPVPLLRTVHYFLRLTHMIDGPHCLKTKLFINISAYDKGPDLTDTNFSPALH